MHKQLHCIVETGVVAWIQTSNKCFTGPVLSLLNDTLQWQNPFPYQVSYLDSFCLMRDQRFIYAFDFPLFIY